MTVYNHKWTRPLMPIFWIEAPYYKQYEFILLTIKTKGFVSACIYGYTKSLRHSYTPLSMNIFKYSPTTISCIYVLLFIPTLEYYVVYRIKHSINSQRMHILCLFMMTQSHLLSQLCLLLYVIKFESLD